MSKKIIYSNVTDLIDQKFKTVTKEYDVDVCMPDSGSTFTPVAAIELMRRKWNELAVDADPIFAVEFSKSSLLQILMQKGCEGIRFVQCKSLTSEGHVSVEDSLVAMGIDCDGRPLGIGHFQSSPNFSEPIPLIDEKGNRIKKSDIIQQLGQLHHIQKELSNSEFVDSFIKSFRK